MSSVISPVSPIQIGADGVILVNPIAQRRAAGESAAATVGNGQSVLVTTPDSSSTDPVVLNVVDPATSGFLKVAAGTVGVDVYIVGNPLATTAASIQVGLGVDSNGQILSNAGSTVQVADYYRGNVIVNYDGAIPVPGVKVDLGVRTVSDITAASVSDGRLPDDGGLQSTIGANAPSGLTADSLNAPDFYVNTGSGDDQIKGSAFNDFIRAGSGDDTVNAGSGNDIVRAGAGSDFVTLGDGSDVYYLTFDQFLTPSGSSSITRDVISDFNASEDSIQLSSDLESQISFSGLGTGSVVITYAGSQPASVLTIVSNGDAINEILFV